MCKELPIVCSLVMCTSGQYGAVSALDLSFNGERLLVGYARGLVSWSREE